MGWAKYNEDIMEVVYEREMLRKNNIINQNATKKTKDFSWIGAPVTTELGEITYDFDSNEIRVFFKTHIDVVLLKKLTSFGWKHNKKEDYWHKPIKAKNIEYAKKHLLIREIIHS